MSEPDSDEIALNCWIIGDDPDFIFPIHASPATLILDLKIAIVNYQSDRQDWKRAKPEHFTLWKTSTPRREVDEELYQSLSQSDFKSCSKLRPLDTLEDSFSLTSLHERIIHILVLPPTSPQVPLADVSDLEVARTLHETLWCKPFDPFISKGSMHIAGALATFNFISNERIKQLRLSPDLKFRESILFIRDEYEAAFRTMVSWSRQNTTGIVVTGQPGIGKTCFIFYALLLRLSAGLPTAFQVHVDRFFLFTHHGGSVHSTSSSSASVIPAECWALADSNESIWQPCIAFLDSNAWVIQASSPQPSRWKEWTKQRGGRLYVMDYFSRQEMHVLGELLKLDRSALMSHFDDWGPSARTCINLVRDTKRLSTMVHDAWNAAVAFVDSPEVVLSTALEPSEQNSSHALFSVRPKGLSDQTRSEPIAAIATPNLLGFITLAIASRDIARQTRFFSMISAHPWTQSLSGYVFTTFLHVRLTTPSDAEGLICEPVANTHPRLVLPVCSASHLVHGISSLKGADRFQLPSYIRPTSTTFTSLDAIILTNQEVILLQSTVAHPMRINDYNLPKIQSSLPVRFRALPWNLVFVTDDIHRLNLSPDLGTSLKPPAVDLRVYRCSFRLGQRLAPAQLEAVQQITGLKYSSNLSLKREEAREVEKTSPSGGKRCFASARRSAHTTATLNWLTASHIRASLRAFHVDARDLRELSAINNFLADVDNSLEEFLFTTSVFPADAGWLIDLSQHEFKTPITIELRHLPGSPNDYLWLTQMLSQIVSVHLQEIRLQIVWGASHVVPYFLDWRGMDEVLVRPQFANLKKVTVAAQHGIQFLQRPAFPDWLRDQLSGCYSRQILFINDS